MTDNLDPTEEIVLREFHPKPFRWEEIDPAQVVVSFDRRSDTLLIHLFGRGRGGISVHVANYLYLLVDPDTEETTGIHIEGFLGQAVKDVPEAIDLLDYAELRGITSAELQVLQRESLAGKHLPPVNPPTANGKSIPERRMEAVTSFIETERSYWSPKVPFLGNQAAEP